MHLFLPQRRLYADRPLIWHNLPVLTDALTQTPLLYTAHSPFPILFGVKLLLGLSPPKLLLFLKRWIVFDQLLVVLESASILQSVLDSICFWGQLLLLG